MTSKMARCDDSAGAKSARAALSCPRFFWARRRATISAASEAFCREDFSSYKIPAIYLIGDSEFPLSSSVKIDRNRAAAQVVSFAGLSRNEDGAR
jgi:acyl-CoA synthetase (AMP-forming)/AMP-acid ligase II